MGFADVKTDGFVIKELQEKIERYNEVYFGKGVQLGVTTQKKGQLEQFEDSKKKYLDQQFDSVKRFFQGLEWDYTEKEDGAFFRANSDIYVEYRSTNGCYIEFKNGDIKKVYNVDVKSDFKENPHYKLNTDKRRYGVPKYIEKGGIATKAEVINERLKDIKEVIEYNDSLKGIYNFKIIVEKDVCIYDSKHEVCEYDSLMEVIEEISAEYF